MLPSAPSSTRKPGQPMTKVKSDQTYSSGVSTWTASWYVAYSVPSILKLTTSRVNSITSRCHQSSAVQDYCIACHEHIETLLIKQNDTDEAELKQISDAIKVKEEAEWLPAKEEEKERAEKARKMAQEQS